MIRGKYLTSMNDIGDVLAVRAAVPEFLGAGRDEFDQFAVYAVCFDDLDAPCGCGRMYIDPDSRFRVDTIGVLPQNRNVGCGDLIVRMLLDRAIQLSAASVSARVPSARSAFFARYGFHGIEDAGAADDNEMRVNADEFNIQGACARMNCAGGDCQSCKDAKDCASNRAR